MLQAHVLKRWLAGVDDDQFIAIEGLELVAVRGSGRVVIGAHVEVGGGPADERWEPVPLDDPCVVLHLPPEAAGEDVEPC